MARVSGRDYRAVLAIGRDVALAPAVDPVPRHVLDAIRRLIPSDMVAAFEGLPWDRARRRIWSVGGTDPLGPVAAREYERLRFQFPLWPSPATVDRAASLDDFLDRRAWHRTDIYQLFGRADHIEHSMSYWEIGRDGVVRGLALDSADHAYGARDRAVLEVLAPQVFAILAGFERHLPVGVGARLTSRQVDVLTLVARGRSNTEIAVALGISPETVRTHLEHAYERLGVHSRAEAIATIYDTSASSERTGRSATAGRM